MPRLCVVIAVPFPGSRSSPLLCQAGTWRRPPGALLLVRLDAEGVGPRLRRRASTRHRLPDVQQAVHRHCVQPDVHRLVAVDKCGPDPQPVLPAPGPLGEEIKEALAEIRLGRARGDALKAAGDRTNQPDFRNALRAMTQAERMGANIANILTDLAQDARHRRLMFVEEMAAKLPVKMVFPMVFFMIPAIFTIIFGTVAANYFAPK